MPTILIRTGSLSCASLNKIPLCNRFKNAHDSPERDSHICRVSDLPVCRVGTGARPQDLEYIFVGPVYICARNNLEWDGITLCIRLGPESPGQRQVLSHKAVTQPIGRHSAASIGPSRHSSSTFKVKNIAKKAMVVRERPCMRRANHSAIWRWLCIQGALLGRVPVSAARFC